MVGLQVLRRRSKPCVICQLCWNFLFFQHRCLMLLLIFWKGGKAMQELKQLNLFKPRTASWIVRVWDTVDGERRQQIVTILAEMVAEMTKPSSTKEQDHAPR